MMVDLAAAGRAQQGDSLARLGAEIDIAQHWVAALEVAEGHVFKGDTALDLVQRNGVRLVLHIVVGVEDLKDARGAGRRLGHQGDDEPQLPHGDKDERQIEAELLPFANGERAVDDGATTEVEDGGLPQVGNQENQRKEEGKHAADMDALLQL